MSEELSEGQDFPSVRTLAAELKIHPNTAHKAIQYLIHEGWLEMRPGLGTVVGSARNKLKEMRQELMHSDVAALVSGARRLGIEYRDLIAAIDAEWKKSAQNMEARR